MSAERRGPGKRSTPRETFPRTANGDLVSRTVVYGETSLQALLLCIVVGATEVDLAIRDAGGRPDPDEWSTLGRLVRGPV